VSSSDEDILRFVAASFPSVWALELLLALKREPRTWTSSELLESLRASELVVSKALDALVAAGLVSLEGDGVRYLPVNANVAKSVEQAQDLYRSRPNKVRRAIIAAGASSAVAFADAFRLRRDKDG
jgi:DNA-binding IclR family transcriptional regulator